MHAPGTAVPFDQFSSHKGHGRWDKESQCRKCMAYQDRDKRRQEKIREFPPPKPRSELEPRHRKMLDNTPEAFEAFVNEFSNEPFPAHARPWVKAALDNKRLLLNVPPRHAKTTLMVRWFTIWQVARDRDVQIIIVANTTQGAGAASIRGIAAVLENNVPLNQAYGRFRGDKKWTQLEFQVDGKDLTKRPGLTVQIRGSMQEILGMEADWIIADDVTTPRISMSPVQRGNEDVWFNMEVMTRLSPQGKAFCIGQRVHVDDIYGRLAGVKSKETKEPVWALESYPAVLDWEKKTVLWPEVWSYDLLMESWDSIGGRQAFQCLYQQNPETSGEYVREEWIYGDTEHQGCVDNKRSKGEGWKSVSQTEQYIPITRVMSVDPSPTMYNAFVIADVVYLPGSQNFYCSIVDIVRERMGENAMMDTIRKLQEKYRAGILVFEENIKKNIQERPEWNQLTPLFRNVVNQKTGHNKNDTALGVWSLAADFESGRIRLPYADEESKVTSKLLIDEILAYPHGKTDDVVMALWFIKWNYKNLRPLDDLPTRFNRLVGGQTVGWQNPVRR